MANNPPFGINEVISGGYCIGCGVCASYDSGMTMLEDTFGLYQASGHPTREDTNSVCPFSSEKNEDTLGAVLFGGHDSKFDARIGFYMAIYAGHVAEQDYRSRGSSGGIVTWVLVQLLERNHIDGVIHVSETGNKGNLFEFTVSTSTEDIRSRSKSRYYPVHMADVLDYVSQTDKRFAIVGVPCFIKAVRLLADTDPKISERIKYSISIFCGHFKTKSFAEMIAWQRNVRPENLVGIDFRVKNKSKPANQYSIQVKSDGQKTDSKPVTAHYLYGMDWGLGYFKPRACDWCDDIAGETADLACGDAWLPEYSESPWGTNVVIVRNSLLLRIINEGISQHALTLEEVSADKVYQSQAGNYRHRREGLAVRLAEADERGVLHPPKRVKPDQYVIQHNRRRIYGVREKLSARSHVAFRQAKERKSFLYFYLKMLPLETYYRVLNRTLIRSSVKSIRSLWLYLVTKIHNV